MKCLSLPLQNPVKLECSRLFNIQQKPFLEHITSWHLRGSDLMALNYCTFNFTQARYFGL